MILKTKDAYRFWSALHRDFPKIERFGIGQKIELSFLGILELTFSASYLAPEYKIPMLGKAISKLDVVKFFTQIAWENKLIATEKYSELLSRLEEIGRMLGGWRKGLQSKTPIK
ncbi:MAG: four helix bundle protein [bacterium]|nr:four helix bundle protein [bacterium]